MNNAFHIPTWIIIVVIVAPHLRQSCRFGGVTERQVLVQWVPHRVCNSYHHCPKHHPITHINQEPTGNQVTIFTMPSLLPSFRNRGGLAGSTAAMTPSSRALHAGLLQSR